MAFKLLKLAPTLLTLALVAWVVWPYLPLGETGAPAPVAKSATAEKVKAKRKRNGKPANPFEGVMAMLAARVQPRQTSKKAPANNAPASAPASKAGPGKPEEVAEPIQDMVLSATMIRGRKRIAMIDGRIYEPGEIIRDANDEPTSMRVVEIEPKKVLLAQGRRRLELSYSNTLPSLKPEEPVATSSAPGRDPDVSAAISNNVAPELGLLKSILDSPLGSSLMGLSGANKNAAGAPWDAPSPTKGNRRRVIEEEVEQ